MEHLFQDSSKVHVDVISYSHKASNSSTFRNDHVEVDGEEENAVYDMSQDKFHIILSHEKFEFEDGNQLIPRPGSEKDVQSLKKVFYMYGFLHIVLRNLTHEEIIKYLTAFASLDHTNTSCICISILTHGREGGLIAAADKAYSLTEITAIFENQCSLVEKPKGFIVEACRGINEAEWCPETIDDISTALNWSEKVSNNCSVNKKNTFMVYSTTEGYASYTHNESGSLMIQALCLTLEKDGSRTDFKTLLNWTKRKVVATKIVNNKKQTPEIITDTSKKLEFSLSRDTPRPWRDLVQVAEGISFAKYEDRNLFYEDANGF